MCIKNEKILNVFRIYKVYITVCWSNSYFENNGYLNLLYDKDRRVIF